MAFGIWSLVKISLFLANVDENLLRWLFGINGISLTVTVYVLLAVIVLIDMGVRVYVGLSARAEGYGKKKGSLYLIVALAAAVVNAFTLYIIAVSTSFVNSFLVVVAAIAIEATSIAALVLVVVSALRLRHISKKLG